MGRPWKIVIVYIYFSPLVLSESYSLHSAAVLPKFDHHLSHGEELAVWSFENTNLVHYVSGSFRLEIKCESSADVSVYPTVMSNIAMCAPL
jgi:hypothetical protein